jgi:iron(III) transport system ATP-binding protein
MLRIESLSKSFDKGKSYALKDVSFHLKEGDVYAIVGESGSGKTTLIRLIAGLETPDSGFIEMNGKQVSSIKKIVPPEKRNIGLVFQEYALFPHFTLFENILYGISKLKNKKERAEEALNMVGLLKMKDRYPHQLSGGQQQRVALARALAPQPSLLILDEPFSNLDAMLRAQLRNEIFDIRYPLLSVKFPNDSRFKQYAENNEIWSSEHPKNQYKIHCDGPLMAVILDYLCCRDHGE